MERLPGRKAIWRPPSTMQLLNAHQKKMEAVRNYVDGSLGASTPTGSRGPSQSEQRPREPSYNNVESSPFTLTPPRSPHRVGYQSTHQHNVLLNRDHHSQDDPLYLQEELPVLGSSECAPDLRFSSAKTHTQQRRAASSQRFHNMSPSHRLHKSTNNMNGWERYPHADYFPSGEYLRRPDNHHPEGRDEETDEPDDPEVIVMLNTPPIEDTEEEDADEAFFKAAASQQQRKQFPTGGQRSRQAISKGNHQQHAPYQIYRNYHSNAQQQVEQATDKSPLWKRLGSPIRNKSPVISAGVLVVPTTNSNNRDPGCQPPKRSASPHEEEPTTGFEQHLARAKRMRRMEEEEEGNAPQSMEPSTMPAISGSNKNNDSRKDGTDIPSVDAGAGVRSLGTRLLKPMDPIVSLHTAGSAADTSEFASPLKHRNRPSGPILRRRNKAPSKTSENPLEGKLLREDGTELHSFNGKLLISDDGEGGASDDEGDKGLGDIEEIDITEVHPAPFASADVMKPRAALKRTSALFAFELFVGVTTIMQIVAQVKENTTHKSYDQILDAIMFFPVVSFAMYWFMFNNYYAQILYYHCLVRGVIIDFKNTATKEYLFTSLKPLLFLALVLGYSGTSVAFMIYLGVDWHIMFIFLENVACGVCLFWYRQQSVEARLVSLTCFMEGIKNGEGGFHEVDAICLERAADLVAHLKVTGSEHPSYTGYFRDYWFRMRNYSCWRMFLRYATLLFFTAASVIAALLYWYVSGHAATVHPSVQFSTGVMPCIKMCLDVVVNTTSKTGSSSGFVLASNMTALCDYCTCKCMALQSSELLPSLCRNYFVPTVCPLRSCESCTIPGGSRGH